MVNIASGNSIAQVGALIGDAARANILSALMGGQALTAGELARHAGVTAQTTSGHLAKLADAELIAMEKQGRHRYYRLATPEVAQAIHALMTIAASGPKRHHPLGPRDAALRNARTCYDHLAGKLALALADSLCERGYLTLGDGVGVVSAEGKRFFAGFGIDTAAMDGTSKRPLCRTCLDWSERRPHVAGRLGAALLVRLIDLKWVERMPDSRALRVTPAGERGLATTFNLSLT
ncbi:ArsR/SmtB family transcription factor [Aureimonas frigidaquae]|uniref:ArsR family transcriptional regulator n=1 Tax=Aureimonas frigidaquae TaxID=424757 RepID=A0A0N7KY73_9HYPH|nr:metalloregulator ArsR/SmtB family transcription factor [Aureimonas frigidaquae]BAT28921.1 ArsR family transcriptional regulator [Aureimonas frigidaquae]